MRKILMIMFMMFIASICFGQVTGDATPVVTNPEVLPLDYVAIIAGCLLAISECLASLKIISSNSIFQLVVSILKTIVGK